MRAPNKVAQQPAQPVVVEASMKADCEPADKALLLHRRQQRQVAAAPLEKGMVNQQQQQIESLRAQLAAEQEASAASRQAAAESSATSAELAEELSKTKTRLVEASERLRVTTEELEKQRNEMSSLRSTYATKLVQYVVAIQRTLLAVVKQGSFKNRDMEVTALKEEAAAVQETNRREMTQMVVQKSKLEAKNSIICLQAESMAVQARHAQMFLDRALACTTTQGAAMTEPVPQYTSLMPLVADLSLQRMCMCTNVRNAKLKLTALSLTCALIQPTATL